MDRLKVGLEWFTREFTDMWKTVSMLEDNEMTEVSTRKHMIIARLEVSCCVHSLNVLSSLRPLCLHVKTFHLPLFSAVVFSSYRSH